MMKDEYYIVRDRPVAVRAQPFSDAPIVNMFKPNRLFQVHSKSDGWLQTSRDRYIVDSDYVISLKDYNKEKLKNGLTDEIINPPKLDMTISTKSTIQRRARSLRSSNSGISLLADPGVLTENSVVKVNALRVPDIVNGGTIDLSDYKVGDTNEATSDYLTVGKIDEERNAALLIDTTKMPSEIGWVSINNLQFREAGEDEWQDVDMNAIQEQSYYEQLESFISDPIGSAKDFVNNLNNVDVSTLREIYGIPYQFTNLTDPRVTGSGTFSFEQDQIGRKYNEMIFRRMPTLILQAGVPEFMQGFSDEIAAKISGLLLGRLPGTSSDMIEATMKNAGKYYGLKLMPNEYFDAVNAQCRAMAVLLGLQDESVTINGHTDTLDDYDWSAVCGSRTWGYYAGAVQFYINSDAQVTETFANGTTQSQLANKMNQLGATASEMQFLLGGMGKYTGFNTWENFGQEALKTGDARNATGLFDTLVNNISTLMAGGRMFFPEIWNDSQFMRQYSVSIKLDSPDCDDLSIYLNILVPLAHILGFVQPRFTGTNTYISPFLVRGFYKSQFHIDMGIITGCEIKKGEVGAWTQSGLPTQIEVDLTIKDLYNVLTMALQNGTADLIGNPMQLDYLANLCGINIAEPDFLRTVKLWMALRGITRIEDNVRNMYSSAILGLFRLYNNITNPLYRV